MSYPEIRPWNGPPEPAPLLGLHVVRRRLEAALGLALPEPHASLVVGLLLGGSATMPSDFREDLRAVGLGHIVAVSGDTAPTP
jgi:competence protein ComEC